MTEEAQALFGRTILQVTPALDGGDDAWACVEVASALAEAGARALVAGAPGPLVSELQARGGIFLPLAAATGNPLKFMANRRELEELVEHEGVELIHVRAGASLGPALKIARRTRIPLVADYAAGRPEALDADTILVVSRDDFEGAKRLRPDAAKNLRQSLRGVDLRRFGADTIDSTRIAALRAAIGVKPHVRLIVGLELPPDYQALFLAAAGTLRDKGFFSNEAQEVRMVWLERRRKTQDFQKAQELTAKDVSGEVASLAWDDRAAACLASALVVLPSSAPRLCIEAQALGAAIAVLHPPGADAMEEVAPPSPPPSNGRPPQRGVWIIPVNQPHTLARACEEAVRLGASARESLARRARAQASAYSVERMCRLALAAYARHFLGTAT